MYEDEQPQDDSQYKDYVESAKYEGWQDTYNTLMLRLDPTPALEKIKYMLLNYKYNGDEDRWEEGDLPPKMKKEGVDELMLELYARVTVDKILSKLAEKRINIYVKQLREVILSFIWHNATKYEIQRSQRRSIVMIVIHNVDIILRRALGGTENLLLNKGMQFRFTEDRRMGEQMQQQQQPRQGIKWKGLRGGF